MEEGDDEDVLGLVNFEESASESNDWNGGKNGTEISLR